MKGTTMNSKNEPYLVKGEKDKNYAWCACAESENQPFCDGKHAKTDQQPVVFKARKRWRYVLMWLTKKLQMHHIVMVHI